MKNAGILIAVVLSILLISSCNKKDPTPSNSGTVTDIDGNTYNTVALGYQVWMKENLKTTKFNDGTVIPILTDNIEWGGMVTPGCSWYNNDPVTFKSSYGALYNWFVVYPPSNGGKNVCPVGWHVPSNVDWTILVTYLGGASVAGIKLQETGTEHWASPNTAATNESGFTALPAGIRYHNSGDIPPLSDFIGIGIFTQWWSLGHHCATARIGDSSYSYDIPDAAGFAEQMGYSIRCLKD